MKLLPLKFYQLFVFIAIIGLPFLSLSQKSTIHIFGKVTDFDTKKPLSHVNIAVENTIIGTTTDKQGTFKLKVKNRNNFTLAFSYIGYEPFSKKVKANQLTDTLFINAELLFKPNVLDTFSVSSVSHPDTVFGSAFFSIADFEISQDKFIFLTYEKRLEKGSKVALIADEKTLISQVEIPAKAKELFKDFLGNINVICENSVYSVTVEDKKIELTELPFEKFNSQLKPVVDTLEHKLVYSDYSPNLPHFDYYALNLLDTTKIHFKQVKDKPLEREYRFEYYYLKPKDKLMARKIAAKTGFDKHDVAAAMTNFSNSLYYQPLYAPLFVIDDTVMIFDHYENKLFKYDEFATLLDSVSINYHQLKSSLKWKRKVIKDEQNDKIYTLYEKNGYAYLRKIDTESGQPINNFKLFHRYVEKIKIKNDYIYYIYRPFESLQKKFLYKELIRSE